MTSAKYIGMDVHTGRRLPRNQDLQRKWISTGRFHLVCAWHSPKPCQGGPTGREDR
jgi:hypothetical protein